MEHFWCPLGVAGYRIAKKMENGLIGLTDGAFLNQGGAVQFGECFSLSPPHLVPTDFVFPPRRANAKARRLKPS